MDAIPVYQPRSPRCQNPALYCFVEPGFLIEHGHHLDIVRNKRGHPKRAYLKSLNQHCCRLLPRLLGRCIEQKLPNAGGFVYALGGVRGSA